MEKKILNAAIILLYVLMILVSTQFFFDDLGFDYSGYALRYNSLFENWLQDQHLGIPVGTFDLILPGFLPFLIKLIGIGSFTLPLTISILIIRMIVPFAFAYLGKNFGFNKKLSFLAGIFFVFNPILFKFFNRFYEFTAWLFFVMAFAAFYKFLKEEKFSKKYFGLSILFVCLTAFSHLGALIFVGLAFLFLIETKKELKKLLLTGLISAGIMAFWIIPFISFLNYSVVQEQKGMLLTSSGIVASGAFLATALIVMFLIFWKFKIKHQKINRLLAGSSVLSIIILVFPLIPILEKPFAHSYHAFFVFVLLLAFLVLIKEKIITKKQLMVLGAVILITIILTFPIIERQYLFEEPRLTEYKINEIELLVKEIPENTRFELLPFNPVIHAYIAVNQKKLSLNGWGYNAYTIKYSDEIGTKMISMKLSCKEFTEGIEKTATNYWIATEEKGENYLKECGLKEKNKSNEFPKLYYYENFSSLVENGKLIEFSNEKTIIDSFEGNVLLKQSFFPGWNAYQNGVKLEIRDKKPGIEILDSEKGLIELKYEKHLFDWIGIIISLISILVFFFLMKKSH
ncbi:MAG: hypothetical protein COT90_03540 [Candidatus Diapherotrites archaeon CG10_big_fil_rev_8_21_14_0_10_31_34]|nr:MAG: hypothetical protein COT90_03540 [Candidatus Diapherotrites archaeon CG10_big_fil_rev_8_21_14_0_10_31_34]